VFNANLAVAETAHLCRRGADMKTAKLTILYSRLSREDERENESVSIENQKTFLEEYAIKNGFTNFIHLTDDGWSGTRWDRPGYMQMMEKVDNGEVGQICIKDMSRLGRDHLRVGLFLEGLRDKNVRLIAVAENIDTAKGEDDFMPFRNLFAEWHARDTSRKIRAINDSRTKDGKRVSGAIPYGYLRGPQGSQEWILDEEAAPIVKRMFRSVIEGKGPSQIADELSAENILIPTAHWTKINAGQRSAPNAKPTRWSASAVITILKKEEYMGWKVLNKTTKESYKTKKRTPNPNKLIFKDSHPAIVDEETWTIVQRLRGTRRKPILDLPPQPLTGVLFCADCGYKMYHKRGKTGRLNKPHNEYMCTSYRHYSRHCTVHYIRAEVVEELILDTIRRTCGYVRKNELDFIKRVQEMSEAFQETAIKESRRKLTKSKRRREEIRTLIKKLCEMYAIEKIPENHFSDMMKSYDEGSHTLDGEIEKLQSEIEKFNTEGVKADKFIELVKRHTEFTTFSAILLNEFIEKVIIHEAKKINGKRTQQVDIYLNYIGKFELPQSEYSDVPLEEPPKLVGSRGRKLRRDMTPEELAHERELDAQYYARKKAKRVAAEEKRRAEILHGTSFADVQRAV
jgi:DNA invertase Pin-like site-specific DNA recombinase